MSADIIGGAATAVGSLIGAKQRQGRQKQAQSQLNRDVARHRSTAIENPYENFENFAEDLSVDDRAFDQQYQQGQQNLSNVLDQFQQGSGAGIGGSAQALAQAATGATQGIGTQRAQLEQQNQQLRAQGSQAAQQARAQGIQYTQDLQESRNRYLTNQSQLELDSATQARQQATSDLAGGIGQAVGGVAAAFGDPTALFK